eukprot:scaffold1624_cov105-Cylindrotheca_fusiformis.AAC.2
MRFSKSGKIKSITLLALLTIHCVECDEIQFTVSLPQEEMQPPSKRLRSLKSGSSRKSKGKGKGKGSKSNSGSKSHGSKGSSSRSSGKAGFLDENIVDEFQDLFNMVHESRDFSMRYSSRRSSGGSKSSKKSASSSKGKGKGGGSSSTHHDVPVEHTQSIETTEAVATSEIKSSPWFKEEEKDEGSPLYPHSKTATAAVRGESQSDTDVLVRKSTLRTSSDDKKGTSQRLTQAPISAKSKSSKSR